MPILQFTLVDVFPQQNPLPGLPLSKRSLSEPEPTQYGYANHLQLDLHPVSQLGASETVLWAHSGQPLEANA